MKKPFLEALSEGGLVGDGAMGSLLYERGVYINRSFDQVNLLQPELVYGIHRDYLQAGAHLLESNTYGANRIRLEQHGLAEKTEEINVAAMDILRRAAERAAYLGGSLGPTGLGPGEVRRRERQVRNAYAEQARLLVENGADIILVESFREATELRLAVESARSEVEVPIVAQFGVEDDAKLRDGTEPGTLAGELALWGADVVGANCNGPDVIFDAVSQMVSADILVCAFPNAGHPHTVEDRLFYLATPENFGVFARRMYKAGVHLVGGCCGTGPSHITRVGAAARMVSPRSTIRTQEVQEQSARVAPIPIPERSHFGSNLGKRFLISVEVNPGPGLSTEHQVDVARSLTSAGADIINISDGPRATARMTNLVLAHTMQSQLGIETLLHVCCRDRNLLGLQASVLGYHVLGIRNLVVITGDPPKVGDYPEASAVYDLDSIGLLTMIDGFNHGVDPAGKPLGEQTAFVLATGVEPAAGNFEREMVRVRQKVGAGANLIMTQPIYNPTHLDRFLDASTDLDAPVLVGILPLASYRNAEFIHNNIPGMSIPEEIRERMRRAGKGEAARKAGVEIAIESLMGVRDRVSGAYIMPPLGRYEMASQIIEAVGEDRSIAASVPGRSREESSGTADVLV